MYGYSDPSLHDLDYKGHSYVEIRRNGDSFFTADGLKKKFQFGRYKALMLLTCKEVIDEFAHTDGRKPASNVQHCMKNGLYIPVCTCTKHDTFETSYGIIVTKPYLKIESGGTNIGLGVQKAKSLTLLMPEIEEFVASTR